MKHNKQKTTTTILTATLTILAALLLLHKCDNKQPQTITIVAAGGMSCDPKDPGIGTQKYCQDKAVSDIALKLNPYAVIGLGDYQYEIPTTEAYNTIYNNSWGRLKNITYPALGNQEYKVHEANTFHTYFDKQSGPNQGYWSTQLGQWHIIFLNSNCTTVTGGCKNGSPQQQWLEKDLNKNTTTCTLAVLHHPRWSNGIAGADARTQDLYTTLYNHNTDIILSAHEANYERFAPLNPEGNPDRKGITTFVVGTGGQATYNPEEGNADWRARTPSEHSQKLITDRHGLLKLTLQPDQYSWSFYTTLGTEEDQGQQVCNKTL